MQGHVNNLHCRYKVYSQHANKAGVVNKLEGMVKETVIQAYESALEQIYGDDEQVIVIREVNSALLLNLANNTPSGIAKRWGQQLAGAVIDTISASHNSSDNIIRFNNQAEYVTQFLTDILKNRAWQQWYYGAFEYLKPLSQQEIIFKVLADNSLHISLILAHLSTRNVLGDVLSQLPSYSEKSLWQMTKGVNASSSDPQIILRIEEIFQLMESILGSKNRDWTSQTPTQLEIQKLKNRLDELPWLDSQQIIQTLEKFADSKISSRNENELSESDSDLAIDNKKRTEIFQQVCQLINRLNLWSENASSTELILHDYINDESKSKSIIDWKDQSTLNSIFCEMLQFMFDRVCLKVMPGIPSAEFLSQLDEVLLSYDWLDVSRIKNKLLANFSGQNQKRPNNNISLSTRQKLLFENLVTVLEKTEFRGLVSFEKISLQMYASLISDYPQWAEDDLAHRIIEGLAVIQSNYVNNGLSSEIAGWLRSGNIETIFNRLENNQESKILRSKLEMLSSYGDSAIEVIEKITEQPSTSKGYKQWQSDNAGVYLLLRTIADLQLPKLAIELGYPGGENNQRLPSLVASIFKRFSSSGRNIVDESLACLYESEEMPTTEQLKSNWQTISDEHHDVFLEAIFKKLAGQRIITGERIHLYELSAENKPEWLSTTDCSVLVIGDESGKYYPLAKIISNGDRANHIKKWLTNWVETWATIVGVTPKQVVTSRLLASDCEEHFPELEFIATEIDISNESNPETQSNYNQGLKNLRQTMAALNQGCCDIPETDLALAILSITVLNTWARWVPNSADSSVPYLLKNFINRSGQVTVDKESIDVALESAPLDVLLEMSSYLSDYENVEWLSDRTISFSVRRAI